MSTEAKVLLGITIGSLIILFSGVFFASFADKKQSDSGVNQEILLRYNRNRIGNENAKVTIVEFADFQCPACRAVHPNIKKVLEEYKDNVTFVYRHFTLSQHEYAVSAALASEAAGRQGKFWEMYDKIYVNQKEWESSNAPEYFEKYAKELGLDMKRYSEDLKDPKLVESIKQDTQDGDLLGVSGTPTFFINGKKLVGQPSYDNLKKSIENELKSK